MPLKWRFTILSIGGAIFILLTQNVGMFSVWDSRNLTTERGTWNNSLEKFVCGFLTLPKMCPKMGDICGFQTTTDYKKYPDIEELLEYLYNFWFITIHLKCGMYGTGQKHCVPTIPLRARTLLGTKKRTKPNNWLAIRILNGEGNLIIATLGKSRGGSAP